jgi:murein DD-endopeptidase MepM/ murein hydrolase activator NlpD
MLWYAVDISTVVRQLYRKNTPLTVAVFLVVVFLASSAWFLRKTGLTEERGILGGPTPSLLSSAEGAELQDPALLDATSYGGALAGAGDAFGNNPAPATAAVALPDAATMKDPGEPVGSAFDRSGTIAYTVRQGDNLGKIASYFGISVDTIASANPGVKTNFLKVGQNLNILPTSGVVYRARSTDTLQSIADDFGVAQDKILQFNRSVSFASLDPGTPVIIPGGKNTDRLATGGAVLPNFNGQFIMPANGYDWGILHHYNAVDIANSCGTPVVAAAEGLVIPDENTADVVDGWNDGYGNFVLIEHPFGDQVKTRYAHLQKISVQVGDYVKQGDVIGLMGETGEATGCHVHFEVYGAQNPFAKS